MNYRAIFLGILLVMGLSFVGGFAIGLAAGKAMFTSPRIMLAAGILNFFLTVIAFCISGVIARTQRFNNLAVIAVVCWLLSAPSIFLNPAFTFDAWLLSFIFIAIAMVAGCGLSRLLVPVSKTGASAG